MTIYQIILDIYISDAALLHHHNDDDDDCDITNNNNNSNGWHFNCRSLAV